MPAADFEDSVVDRLPATRGFATRSAWWGGPVTASTGEAMRVFYSDWFLNDADGQAHLQSWANFFGWLAHGSELARLTVYLVPWDAIAEVCGAEAAACYAPSVQSMAIPGDWPDGYPAAHVAAHEFGHHIATNRDNAPWPAVDWGTKRWASHVGVCQRAASGTAFPGDENGNYTLNPGEAFAEAYRFSQAARVTDWPSIPLIVDPSFTPDSTALALVNLDVAQPWTGPTASTWADTFVQPKQKIAPKKRAKPKAKGKAKAKPKKRPKRKTQGLTQLAPKTLRLDTPNDGILTVTLDQGPGMSLTLLDGATGQPVTPPSASSITYTVCGQRSFTLSLQAAQPAGFSVTISTP